MKLQYYVLHLSAKIVKLRSQCLVKLVMVNEDENGQKTMVAKRNI